MINNIHTIEYSEAEEKFGGAKFADVRIPPISQLYARLEQPMTSPYTSTFQKRILGILMAVPVMAAALALFMSFGNSGSGVYLAQNDAGLDQANATTIINNINALEHLSE